MKNANAVQWRELFNLCGEIAKLEPWAKYKDTHFFAVETALDDEPYFLSFMAGGGRGAISCLRGFSGLYAFLDVMSAKRDKNAMMFEQNAMNAYYARREELTQDDLNLIRDIGYEFDDEYCLYFRSYEPGYVPWLLSLEEVLVISDMYRHLLEVLRALESGELRVQFGLSQILSRRYNHATESWVNEQLPFSLPARQYQSVLLDDELLMARMIKRPLIDARLELDSFYLGTPVDDPDYRKPFYPKMVMLADRTSGAIVEFEVFTPEDNEIETVLAIMIAFLEKHGRPLMLYLQEPQLLAMIAEFCRALMIPYEPVNFLPAINAFKLSKGLSFSDE